MGFSYKKTTIQKFFCQVAGMFSWELAALLDKGCAGGVTTGANWMLPTGSSIKISWLS